jgi:hypothetical protein
MRVLPTAERAPDRKLHATCDEHSSKSGKASRDAAYGVCARGVEMEHVGSDAGEQTHQPSDREAIDVTRHAKAVDRHPDLSNPAKERTIRVRDHARVVTPRPKLTRQEEDLSLAPAPCRRRIDMEDSHYATERTDPSSTVVAARRSPRPSRR